MTSAVFLIFFTLVPIFFLQDTQAQEEYTKNSNYLRAVTDLEHGDTEKNKQAARYLIDQWANAAQQKKVSVVKEAYQLTNQPGFKNYLESIKKRPDELFHAGATLAHIHESAHQLSQCPLKKVQKIKQRSEQLLSQAIEQNHLLAQLGQRWQLLQESNDVHADLIELVEDTQNIFTSSYPTLPFLVDSSLSALSQGSNAPHVMLEIARLYLHGLPDVLQKNEKKAAMIALSAGKEGIDFLLQSSEHFKNTEVALQLFEGFKKCSDAVLPDRVRALDQYAFQILSYADDAQLKKFIEANLADPKLLNYGAGALVTFINRCGAQSAQENKLFFARHIKTIENYAAAGNGAACSLLVTLAEHTNSQYIFSSQERIEMRDHYSSHAIDRNELGVIMRKSTHAKRLVDDELARLSLPFSFKVLDDHYFRKLSAQEICAIASTYSKLWLIAHDRSANCSDKAVVDSCKELRKTAEENISRLLNMYLIRKAKKELVINDPILAYSATIVMSESYPERALEQFEIAERGLFAQDASDQCDDWKKNGIFELLGKKIKQGYGWAMTAKALGVINRLDLELGKNQISPQAALGIVQSVQGLLISSAYCSMPYSGSYYKEASRRLMHLEAKTYVACAKREVMTSEKCYSRAVFLYEKLMKEGDALAHFEFAKLIIDEKTPYRGQENYEKAIGALLKSLEIEKSTDAVEYLVDIFNAGYVHVPQCAGVMTLSLRKKISEALTIIFKDASLVESLGIEPSEFVSLEKRTDLSALARAMFYVDNAHSLEKDETHMLKKGYETFMSDTSPVSLFYRAVMHRDGICVEQNSTKALQLCVELLNKCTFEDEEEVLVAHNAFRMLSAARLNDDSQVALAQARFLLLIDGCGQSSRPTAALETLRHAEKLVSDTSDIHKKLHFWDVGIPELVSNLFLKENIFMNDVLEIMDIYLDRYLRDGLPLTVKPEQHERFLIPFNFFERRNSAWLWEGSERLKLTSLEPILIQIHRKLCSIVKDEKGKAFRSLLGLIELILCQPKDEASLSLAKTKEDKKKYLLAKRKEDEGVAKALDYFKSASDDGDINARVLLGALYLARDGKAEQSKGEKSARKDENTARGLEILTPLADQNNLQALITLMHFYATHRNMGRSHAYTKKAYELYPTDPLVCFKLSCDYLLGLESPKSSPQKIYQLLENAKKNMFLWESSLLYQTSLAIMHPQEEFKHNEKSIDDEAIVKNLLISMKGNDNIHMLSDLLTIVNSGKLRNGVLAWHQKVSANPLHSQNSEFMSRVNSVAGWLLFLIHASSPKNHSGPVVKNKFLGSAQEFLINATKDPDHRCVASLCTLARIYMCLDDVDNVVKTCATIAHDLTSSSCARDRQMAKVLAMECKLALVGKAAYGNKTYYSERWNSINTLGLDA